MSKTIQKRFSLTEVSQIAGVDEHTIVHFIEMEWILPPAEKELDREDVARIQLIQELRSSFGANDEAVPLILHLMDQLYYLRHQVRQLGSDRK